MNSGEYTVPESEIVRGERYNPSAVLLKMGTDGQHAQAGEGSDFYNQSNQRCQGCAAGSVPWAGAGAGAIQAAQ
jgi:hypothetical protein